MSGRMKKQVTQPRARMPTEHQKGRCQSPVRCTMAPKVIGETIAATAEPKFISPLAVPANFGAMSIGIAHMGPMASSRKKNPAARQIVTGINPRRYTTGTRHTMLAR